MGKWENKKILGERTGNEIIVEEGINQFRLTYGGKWYYILKDENSKEGFEAGDYTTFLHRIEELNKKKSSRKDRKRAQQYYNRLLKKIKNKSVIDGKEIAENIVETAKISDPESNLEDVKKEVGENVKKALNVEAEEEKSDEK